VYKALWELQQQSSNDIPTYDEIGELCNVSGMTVKRAIDHFIQCSIVAAERRQAKVREHVVSGSVRIIMTPAQLWTQLVWPASLSIIRDLARKEPTQASEDSRR
jgi:predicted transcriptional regulator